MTTVVISQPMLFPWPGFFEQLGLADVYIYLDDVQFSKGSFTNRVQIGLGDKAHWLTIPLRGKGSFQLIRDLAPADDGWRSQHVAQLNEAFAAAPWKADALALLGEAYRQPDLASTLIAGIEAAAGQIGIGKARRILRSSGMGVGGRSWQRVLDLVKAVGGTRYVTGHGAANYLDHRAFEAEGVDVRYMDYSLTTWPRNGAEQTPYLSILDLLAWTGPAAATYLHPATVTWREFVSRGEEIR